jgi:hypothetical protein
MIAVILNAARLVTKLGENTGHGRDANAQFRFQR